MIIKLGETPLTTKYGEFQFCGWYDGHKEAYSIHLGDVVGKENVPTRIHSSCITAHYFNSTECDCREQFEIAQAYIADKGFGVIIVLDQQAKANGILATLRYKQEVSKDAYSADAYVKMGLPADARTYISAASIIKNIGISSIELLSNSPDKKCKLERSGIIISGEVGVLVDVRDRPDLINHYIGKRDSEKHSIGQDL